VFTFLPQPENHAKQECKETFGNLGLVLEPFTSGAASEMIEDVPLMASETKACRKDSLQ
jgi:hypothetical protein